MRLIPLTGMLALLLAGSALAETTKTPAATPENVCLRTNEIDHTTSPDDKTILFYVRQGKVWRNALVTNCPMLSVNGFEYSPTPSREICGNMQSIRVLRTGSVCLLGSFTEQTPVGAQ